MAVTGSAPLVGAAVSTSASAPVMKTINRYDATSGALAPTLPALSGISTGATLIVQKSQADTTSNAVTITCTGGDTFDDATTTLAMKSAGDLRHLQCVLVSGTKYWKVIGTAATGSASGLSVTGVKTSTYTAAVSELIPVDATSGAFTVTLPTAPATGSRISLKKIDSSTNAVTVAAGGADVFNKTSGPTTLSMAALNQAITVQYASGVWLATTNDVPISTLDTRYAKYAGQWQPTNHNIIAWAYDPGIIAANQVPASGTVWVVGLQVPAGTITNVILNIGTAGATLTSGQCFAGLYQGGTLLAATADQSASWNSTGLKTMALTSAQTVTAGLVYVAFFSNGTTNPAFSRGTSSANTAANVGLASSASRYATADTGRTTSLASTLGTLSAVSTNVWAAVS